MLDGNLAVPLVLTCGLIRVSFVTSKSCSCRAATGFPRLRQGKSR